MPENCIDPENKVLKLTLTHAVLHYHCCFRKRLWQKYFSFLSCFSSGHVSTHGQKTIVIQNVSIIDWLYPMLSYILSLFFRKSLWRIYFCFLSGFGSGHVSTHGQKTIMIQNVYILNWLNPMLSYFNTFFFFLHLWQ